MSATNLDVNLTLLRTIYGISYVFGFRLVAETLYRMTFREDGQTAFSMELVAAMVGAMALLLLALRLFWAVGNIRRYVEEAQGASAYKKVPRGVAASVTLFHEPIFLLHSFMFYVLCASHSDLFTLGIFATVMPRFVYIYSALLLLNVVWLLTLMTRGDPRAPEWFWILNNSITMVAAPVAMLSFLSWGWPALHVYLAVMMVFLFNSGIDLFVTARSYLTGENA